MERSRIARRIAKTAAAGLMSASVTAMLAACGSSASPVTGHGTITLYSGILGGVSVQEAYPDLTAGSQVTVTNSAGTVIGTGTLTPDAKQTELDLIEAVGDEPSLTAEELLPYVAVYDFTVTVPGSQARYGISVGKNRGTIWESPSQIKDPTLTLGSLSGS
jgi:hypothetical protein